MTDKKLKIILINYRYFVSGGPERYMFNVTDLLQKNGHEVIPFSVKNKQNAPTKYEKYFLEPVGKNEEVYFSDNKTKSLKKIFLLFTRMYYSFEAKKKLGQLIQDEKPDLIYILYYQNKISASILDAAKKYKIPVVHRLSDHGHICANVQFFRPKKNDICERCIHGSKWNAVVNKCVYDSYVYSALKAGSISFEDHILKIKSKIDAFVIPSEFTIKKHIEGGFPVNKITYIPTFFNIKNNNSPNISYQPFALYLGRIEDEKGVFTLIKAFINTNFKLKIIGFSNTGLDEKLKQYLQDKQHNIEFLGRKNFDEIVPYLETCAFTIVPSECYDNFPNTVLESYAFKKAVIATNVGSLAYMVNDKQTGLLFTLKDHLHLREKVEILFGNLNLCEQYGINGYAKLIDEYSESTHYTKLIGVFNTVLNK